MIPYQNVNPYFNTPFIGSGAYLPIGYPQMPYQDYNQSYSQGYYPATMEQPVFTVTEPYAQQEDFFMNDFRPERDVNRVMRIIDRQEDLYREMTRGGMDRKLANYLFRTMVVFVDENYNDFSGTINQRVNQATNRLRRRYPWIFDIMSLYSVSPASQVRVVNSVLSIAFENLRRRPDGGPIGNPR